METSGLVGRFRLPGEEDHGHVPRGLLLAQRTVDIVAADEGHHHVEQHEVRRRCARAAHRFEAVPGEHRVEARVAQRIAQDASQLIVVVDDEDTLGHVAIGIARGNRAGNDETVPGRWDA